GSEAAQGNEDLALQPVLRRPEHRLAELAPAGVLAARQDADLMNRAGQDQRQDGVAGFVVRGRRVVGRFHAVSLPLHRGWRQGAWPGALVGARARCYTPQPRWRPTEG